MNCFQMNVIFYMWILYYTSYGDTIMIQATGHMEHLHQTYWIFRHFFTIKYSATLVETPLSTEYIWYPVHMIPRLTAHGIGKDDTKSMI